jgi:photosystem II stability/assembly factor-like uncharacterized protein
LSELSPSVNDLVADPSRPGTWYLACAGTVLKTQDGGETWDTASQGLRPYEYVRTIALAPSDPDALFILGWDTFPVCGSAACPDQKVFRSTDGGGRWRGSRVSGLDRFRLLGSLAVDRSSPMTVYAAGPGLFRSLDGGATWSKIGRGLRNAVYQIVADPLSSSTLYAIVGLKRGFRVFKSTDRGATWAIASDGMPPGALALDLAPDSTAPGTLYAATSRGVYVTHDGGRLWTAMNEGLGTLPVFTVAVDPLEPGTVYAGRLDGLFKFSATPSGSSALE